MLMYIITIMLFRSGRTFAFTAMVLFSNGTKWSEAVVNQGGSNGGLITKIDKNE